jgi:orotidine-5'-phosphate decarboxylase
LPTDFVSKLKIAAASRDSWLCVGLDPALDKLPDCLPETPSGVARFCMEIVRATSASVCVFKPNIAFFEALGADGYRVLKDVVDSIPDDIPVILDAKRGDIGNTADQYAMSYYGELGVDAVTVSPYMGWDAVRPFATWPGKAAIVLCLTSNASASEMQMLRVADEAGGPGEPMFVRVARMVDSWPGACGLVVGATQADMIGTVRGVSPSSPLLIPGVGAQGGDLETSVRSGAWEGGGGAIINASRAVLYASSDSDYADHAAQAAATMRDHIRQAMSP